jgi:uncharacterized membrane protein YbhN (UPF0104 family)
VTEVVTARRSRRRWLPWVGGLFGIAALAWILRGFDFGRFLAVLAGADMRFVALVPLSIMGEQFVRAWKWRQLLHPLRSISTLYLFGTIMAGYLLAVLIPFGFGTVARSWLVARREKLELPSVLATVALDRLTDGIVFACLVPIALLSVVFPDPTGGIRAGLIWGGAGSFALFVLALVALVGYRHMALSAEGRLARVLGRLPSRFGQPLHRLAAGFAEGIAWPRQGWRGVGIVLASLAIKLIAATNFLWAGLAVGVVLEPEKYLFLIVFLGFLIILGHFARVAGSFIIGAVFALGLFGVDDEQALAMVLLVEAASLLSIGGIGALSLWWQGVELGELRTAKADDDAQRA